MILSTATVHAEAARRASFVLCVFGLLHFLRVLPAAEAFHQHDRMASRSTHVPFIPRTRNSKDKENYYYSNVDCSYTNGNVDRQRPYSGPSSSRREWLLHQWLAASGTAILSRTDTANAAIASASSLVTPVVPTPPPDRALYWPTGKVAFSLLPLAGTYTRRKTLSQTIVPDTLWTFDQIQGIVNVNVPVRQTVVKLKNEQGLWVHNPVAPTPELVRMMKDLEKQHGPVKHIVLGTVALEHKATFPAFASKFPNATVWIQPGQWSFPVSVPIELYGLQQRGPRLRELPVPNQPVTRKTYALQAQRDASPLPSWASEIEYEVLGPLKFQSVGAFSETAFYHKATKSLIVTDTVCSVTKDPPAIISEDPRALLFHARDSALDDVQDTPENRRKGWRRMVQFGLVFFPACIKVDTVSQAFKEANQVPPSLQNLGDGAIPGGKLYPWSWDGNKDERNFEAISENGSLFCPPILTKLILDREPDRVLAWADRVAQRFSDMERVIPCHLNNDVRARSSDFRKAFAPLESRPGKLVPQRALAEDLALLQAASDQLTKLGVVAPSQVCDGEPARTQGRFASRK